MARGTRKKAQMECTDRVVEDAELEEWCEALLENAEAEAKHREAAKKIKILAVETHGLQPGEQLRCGEFVIPGTEREGGGFNVWRWKRTVVRGLTSVNEA